MTESSIARSVVDFVCEQFSQVGQPPTPVSRIRLKIGVAIGISPQILKSAFRSASSGTALSQASLEIEMVDLVVWCPQCHQEQLLDNPRNRQCPACQTKTPHIVQGNEFEIVAVELADSALTMPAAQAAPV